MTLYGYPRDVPNPDDTSAPPTTEPQTTEPESYELWSYGAETDAVSADTPPGSAAVPGGPSPFTPDAAPAYSPVPSVVDLPDVWGPPGDADSYPAATPSYSAAPPVPAEPYPGAAAEPDAHSPAVPWGPVEPATPFEPVAQPAPEAFVPDPAWPALAVAEPVRPAAPASPADASATVSPTDLDELVERALADIPEIPDDLDDLDAPPEIPPWDRKPLMIVLAASAVLVLIGVLTGVASASYFRHGPAWQTGGSAAPTPSASPSAEPAVPGAGDGTITLSGVGDVIMGTLPNELPPNAGKGFFDPVKSALAADVVMGNLETPLTADTGRVKCGMVTPPATDDNPSPTPERSKNCYQFYLPTSYAQHLVDGGFDVVNLANNHTNDMGPNGLRNTRSALDAAGVKHTGAPNQITYVEAKGMKVAVIGFAIYSWSQNLNNIPAAKAIVAKAAENADLVVIQMQGGAEGSDKSHVRSGHEFFVGEDRGDLISFSHAVIDAGADAVFGHGPHIMRGMEFYKGRLIAYSLGNFCGYGVLSSAGFNGVGGVLKVTLNKDGSWVDGTLVPTEMVKGGVAAVDQEKRALAFVNGLSKSDFGARAVTIDKSTGKITPPSP